jgi:hypothetical protein
MEDILTRSKDPSISSGQKAWVAPTTGTNGEEINVCRCREANLGHPSHGQTVFMTAVPFSLRSEGQFEKQTGTLPLLEQTGTVVPVGSLR